MSRSSDGSPLRQRREMMLSPNAEELAMRNAGLEIGRTPDGVRNQTTADSAVSTLDMLRQASRHAQSAIETGLSTTRELQMQGEQMEKISQHLDDMEENMKTSDRTLRGFSRRARVINWFRSKLRQKTDPEDENTGVVTTLSAPVGAQISVQPEIPTKQKQEEKVGCSSLTTEEDKMIDSLIYNVGLLRQQALLQGELLDQHNRHLDAITTKTDAVHNHVAKTSKKVAKLS
ncbi:uncharacterized protein TM35_000101300 [Trypanosoma theileri]|uniref:t-SNARE coiled-coil homology domain-containing protein n=1 Tax=Trypanosoma theileri TaxID=67003 RepID=A0A1X0NYU5_9TRYP|nr:uncharacterized protein TM35_000101300 [Trypanosoma theileri]ORC89862.1 hypothetical protein TM35_000101300 [Trypanosoma theileri]